jgi:hypothetical protein
LGPQVRSANIGGKGGTPWTNARWDANPSNPQSTEEDQRYYRFFQALSNAGLKGDPIMWDESGTRVIIRLPTEAVRVLARELASGGAEPRE